METKLHCLNETAMYEFEVGEPKKKVYIPQEMLPYSDNESSYRMWNNIYDSLKEFKFPSNDEEFKEIAMFISEAMNVAHIKIIYYNKAMMNEYQRFVEEEIASGRLAVDS